MTNYGQEIRKLSDEYTRLTGTDAFSGVSGGTASGTYSFDTGHIHNGPEALGYMRERLASLSRGVSRPGEPCLHMPQHARRRGEPA